MLQNRIEARLHRAFSLVELLVVLAIIGILSLILLPVIGAVRTTAHSSRCAGNLRQLAMASQTFSTENDGLIVPWRYRPEGAGLVYWQRSLSKYLDIPASVSKDQVPSRSLLLCPEESANSRGELEYFEASYHTRYSINLHLAWNSEGGSSPTAFRKGYYHDIEYPGLTYLFIDLFGSGGGGHWMGSNLTYPHNGTVNVAFIDGHVEAKSREQMARYLNDTNHVFWRGYDWSGRGNLTID